MITPINLKILHEKVITFIGVIIISSSFLSIVIASSVYVFFKLIYIFYSLRLLSKNKFKIKKLDFMSDNFKAAGNNLVIIGMLYILDDIVLHNLIYLFIANALAVMFIIKTILQTIYIQQSINEYNRLDWKWLVEAADDHLVLILNKYGLKINKEQKDKIINSFKNINNMDLRKYKKNKKIK